MTDGAVAGPQDSEAKLESSNPGTNSQAIHASLHAVARFPVTLHFRVVVSRTTNPMRSNSGNLRHASMPRCAPNSRPVTGLFASPRPLSTARWSLPSLPLSFRVANASALVEAAVKLSKEEKLPAHYETPTVMITRDNFDQFYKKEEEGYAINVAAIRQLMP